MEYIQEGRVKIDRDKFRGKLATVHDPCNYGRKSEKTFGHGYYGELRWIVDQICPDWVDTYPTAENNYCCGAGGGAWAMPYSEERIFYGRKKAEQIQQTGAEIVVAPLPQLPRPDHEVHHQGIQLGMRDLLFVGASGRGPDNRALG